MNSHLKQLIEARHPLISVQSTDEAEELQAIHKVAAELGRNVHDWTLTSGMRVISPDVAEPAVVTGTEKPEHAIRYLIRQTRPLIGVFRGLASATTKPAIRRLLIDFLDQCDPGRECLILLDDESLHPKTESRAVSWRPALPNREELEVIAKETFRRVRFEIPGEVTSEIRKTEFDQLVLNLRGLTKTQAIRVIESVIYDDNRLSSDDLQSVIDEKRRLLESSGSLESVSIDFDIGEVGGLKGLKTWLKQRRGGFTDDARAFGIQPPRGVLMLGIPGCGKSLCAKAVAADWGMPLLRLDPGVLYQKFVGESESQLRQAIRQAEAMAPVILWIDEIEKAFASASSSSADGGLSQRMFGTLLSWMQDHKEPIFIVATANDISNLPPELMRKGRFDEIFFIDLPTPTARRQIFSIHLKRKRREPALFRLEELTDASKDLTGAEIEQAIVSGLFNAFSDGREVVTEDILKSLAETRPLAVMMSERIDHLRQWAAQRCVYAD
ncbi:MAG: AAA family ATPase [Fuerstiella sp.]